MWQHMALDWLVAVALNSSDLWPPVWLIAFSHFFFHWKVTQVCVFFKPAEKGYMHHAVIQKGSQNATRQATYLQVQPDKKKMGLRGNTPKHSDQRLCNMTKDAFLSLSCWGRRHFLLLLIYRFPWLQNKEGKSKNTFRLLVFFLWVEKHEAIYRTSRIW